ncbi:hypothetical protein MTR_7g093690 [Medicago truncatula]|uniref:Uncharacterized protein n=2 Tax=Medicago truncatula TaxID=3880 RepID=G7KWB2_MEDTR|nr:hypothetical protein MTR_7g093690 [Medicago truncatula]
MVKNQNENNTPLTTFIPPATPQFSRRVFSRRNGPPLPPPSSHTMFPMHGRGNYNRRFHPYMRPIQEIPIFPTRLYHNNIDESLGTAMDRLSLIDKPADLAPTEERPMVWGDSMFEIGSTSNSNNNKNNDIDHDLKL